LSAGDFDPPDRRLGPAVVRTAPGRVDNAHEQSCGEVTSITTVFGGCD